MVSVERGRDGRGVLIFPRAARRLRPATRCRSLGEILAIRIRPRTLVSDRAVFSSIQRVHFPFGARSFAASRSPPARRACSTASVALDLAAFTSRAMAAGRSAGSRGAKSSFQSNSGRGSATTRQSACGGPRAADSALEGGRFPGVEQAGGFDRSGTSHLSEVGNLCARDHACRCVNHWPAVLAKRRWLGQTLRLLEAGGRSGDCNALQAGTRHARFWVVGRDWTDGD